MAENKKSVLLYCDIIHTVEPLTDEEAGKLFKHYLRYINDLNPNAEDRLTSLLFEPIKQSLKRDLKKWEEKSNRNSTIAKEGWKKRKDANAYESKKNNANNADRDNVSVSVNDTVSVNVLSKDNLIKKTKVLEFVELSEKEIESIKMKYGDEAYDFCITKLNSYKGSTGKKYKSDYHTIIGWVMDEFNKIKKEKQNGTKHESPTEYAERMYKATLGYNPSQVQPED